MNSLQTHFGLVASVAVASLLGNQISDAAYVTIDTVLVGNAGNSPDDTGSGAVGYEYRIGTYEVTNAQYASFLNEKAKSDPLQISVGPVLSSEGIERNGVSGGYTYSPVSGHENKPVHGISWFSAIRFINWLHNGQGDGDTESGAYTLLGGTPTPSNATSITRNPDAIWWLPNADEWYKAAFHKNDGDTANYFDYATSSDEFPVPEPPAGGSNSANWGYADFPNNLTEVGAYMNSASPYGTFDQVGNVWEWNETVLVEGSVLYADIRGGSASITAPSYFVAGAKLGIWPVGGSTTGFRVATVPEPSSLALACMALLSGLFFWRVRVRR